MQFILFPVKMQAVGLYYKQQTHRITMRLRQKHDSIIVCNLIGVFIFKKQKNKEVLVHAIFYMQ